jgi:hypothetical protein
MRQLHAALKILLEHYHYRVKPLRDFPEAGLRDDKINHIRNIALMSNYSDEYINQQVAMQQYSSTF